MTTITLVACVSKKLDHPAPAKDLYISPWFVKARRYAELTSDHWFILSAKHHLIRPDQVIEPYEKTLLKMPKPARIDWGRQVAGAIVRETSSETDNLIILAGRYYLDALLPFLFPFHYGLSWPLRGLGIGQQLAWLDKTIDAYDPNGDAISLRELGDDIITIGDPGDVEPIRRAHYPLDLALRESGDFIRMVLRDGYSIVVDMRDASDGDFHPLVAFRALVEAHFRQAGKLRVPCFMFVDEAQSIAPQIGANDQEKESRRTLGKVIADGRKRGMLLVAGSQHATYLDKRVIRGANLRIFGKCTYLPDYKVIKEYTPASFQQMLKLRSGEVYIVSEKAWGLTRIKRRCTTDLGQTPAFQTRPRRVRPSINQLQLPMEVA